MRKKLTKAPGICLTVQRGEVFADSVEVAKCFKKGHDDVLKAIRRLECGEEFSLRNFTESTYVNERGRTYKNYLMTRDGWTLLVMGFIGKEATEWKIKYIAAFNRMEKHIRQQIINHQNQQWLEARAQGKQVRREETDTIARFVEYAKAQGSQNADKYFMAISKMENRALFLLAEGLPKPNNLREILDRHQLATLTVADRLVMEELEKGMAEDVYYKDIFQAAKARVDRFSDAVGASAVPSIIMIGRDSRAALATEDRA